MRFVEQVTAGTVRLGPGTLYRTIGRLLADGLVEEAEGGDPHAPHDARRRYYRLTPLGRQAAQAEAALLARMVAAADHAGLLPAKEST
jgi:DNA-binding PadR family transcriptional regulator